MPDFVPDTPPDVAPPVAVTVRIRASDGVADPCRIIPVGKSLDLKAVPTPDVPGTYQWITSSTKVTLTNATSQTVTVQAGAAVSSGLNAETITVTFTPSSGSAASATLTLTVISVVFSAAAGQSWGYDDMDSAAGVDHHVSVRKNSSTTVRVTITGGAVAADLIFTSDDATIADTSPPGGGAAFDLTINGKNQNKSETTLKALCNCPSGHECATLKANVYREKAVTATVAKVYDSTVASTTLTRPNMDMAPAQTRIREWYKPPVATITLTDHSATGGSVDIRYDLNSSGRLELEPGAVSNEQAAITAAFNPTGQKVVIVKDLAWIFYLSAAAAVGDATITLKGSYSGYMKYIHDGRSFRLGAGATEETVSVQSKAGTTITLAAPLTKAHATTEGLIFGLNGLSGNPVWVGEAGKSEEQIRQVIAHECGHAQLNLKDLTPTPFLMHHSTQTRTGTRVRYKEQPRDHDPGNENQWEAVNR